MCATQQSTKLIRNANQNSIITMEGAAIDWLKFWDQIYSLSKPMSLNATGAAVLTTMRKRAMCHARV